MRPARRSPAGRRGAGRRGSLGNGHVWLVFLLALVLAAGPATAAWWWPTQGTWLETAHLSPDDADERGALGNPSHWGIHFGSSVAVDQDVLVVGTQWDASSDGWKTASGDGGDWVFVFERAAGGGWEQTAKLVPDDAHEGDTFGFSVDVDAEEGIVAVGNPAGEKIYIFEQDASGAWTQQASFDRPPGVDGAEGRFGFSVATSDGIVVAGWSPDVLLYEKAKDGWEQTRSLRGGLDVDLAAGRLATSVWDPETGQTEFAIYDDVASTPHQIAWLTPSAPYESDNTVGCTLALNEDATTLVIGACIDRRVFGIPTEQTVDLGASGSLTVSAGAVGSAWVYELVDDSWRMTADIPNPNPSPTGNLFGFSVDASGDRVVIGAPYDLVNGAGDGSGAAYVYRSVEDTWLLESKLRNHDAGPYGGGDLFGDDVGISGDTILVGAPFDDQRRDGTPWPVDDDGDTPPCLQPPVVSGCDEGENAGSAYMFESLDANIGTLEEMPGFGTSVVEMG